ncbi:MAG: CDP-alcohol phosphatidyltransferase family protein [Reichenbachiella sp.]|uniref:CDP-alcohol phosphatidyltransferase family protein n=1 Tax=Reichenbachiella sp. TaxID=2184521 RepID=UPI0032631943
MNIRNIIPNALTSLNLAFGCLAVIEIFEGRLEYVIVYTILSGVADFFDGFAARILNSTSNIGKDLDSLADMVSFGIVPALVMYKMIQIAAPGTYWPYFSVLVAIMSGLRLAKFNNDERQSDQFFGLPTPANAFLIISLAYLVADGVWVALLSDLWVLIMITTITSLLLVIDIPMMAFKFKQYGWKGNELKYIFLIISLGLIVLFQLISLPMIIALYIVLSVAVHIGSKIAH